MRVDAVNVKLEAHKDRIAQLEALFSRPGKFENAAHLATSGEQYLVLKSEQQSLWEEWERLSLEAEAVDGRIVELKAN